MKNISTSLLRLLALCFLVFVAGAATVYWEIFPGTLLIKAFRGGEAWHELSKRGSDVYESSGLWFPAPKSKKSGVTAHIPEKAYPGLTLYASTHAQRAFLITMDGTVAHEWHLPYSRVWESSSPVAKPTVPEYIQWRKLLLYPNGDLLVVVVVHGTTPWGCGLIKIDKESNLIWKYLRHTHHDIDLDEQGNIYALTHSVRKKPLPGAEFLPVPFIEDFLIVLSPQGEELEKISLFEAFRDSRFCAALRCMPVDNDDGDFSHVNSVTVVPQSIAAKWPFAHDGHILLSLREIDMLALLDRNTRKIVWTATGAWRRQHDADVLPSGNILLFSNRGHYGPGGGSKIMEYDPVDNQTVWEYTGTADQFFFTEARGSQQRLLNGNTLVTESERGRIFEVTPGKEIVWEFWNPARGGKNNSRIGVVHSAARVDPDSLAPGFRAVVNVD